MSYDIFTGSHIAKRLQHLITHASDSNYTFDQLKMSIESMIKDIEREVDNTMGDIEKEYFKDE